MRSTIWHQITSSSHSLSGLRVESGLEGDEIRLRGKNNRDYLRLQPHEFFDIDDGARYVRGIVTATLGDPTYFGVEVGDEIVLLDQAIGGCGCGGPAKIPPSPEQLAALEAFDG